MKQDRRLGLVLALASSLSVASCMSSSLPVAQVAPPAAGAKHGLSDLRLALPEPPRATSRHLQLVFGEGSAANATASAPSATTTTPLAATGTPRSLDAKLLVVSADGHETGLPALISALDHMGTPYTLWIATQHPGGLTADTLASGAQGFYQGVILATSNLSYNAGGSWASALSTTEWQALADYEAAFGVRQVTWYTFPTLDLGFGPADAVSTDDAPLELRLTDEGKAAFPYLNPNGTVPVRHAYTYLAAPADSSATPLLTDAAGHAIALVKRFGDGRENLALTTDHNPYLLHSLALAFGVVDWVTRGLFLGDRRSFVSAQIDDLFLDNDMFTGGLTSGADSRETVNDIGETVFRLNGDDLKALVAWQQDKQKDPLSAALKLDMAFNGWGTTPDADLLDGLHFDGAVLKGKKIRGIDSLSEAALAYKNQFKWISHTYTHPYLDGMSYADAKEELTKNTEVAKRLALPGYLVANLVTPNISGLNNPDAMKAAWDTGVRYLVSDTSMPNQDAPKPNTGLPNYCQPGILMIPRRPTNLYYNVSTPAEWTNEYNSFYRGYWGRDLSYAEILDKESDMLLLYLLRGEVDPWMFHQPNLRAYDGQRSLLGDLIDAALVKYSRLVDFPLTSPTMSELGAYLQARMSYNAAGVRATITPGVSITLTARSAAVVPVTGLNGSGAQLYGHKYVSFVPLQAGQSLTLSLK